MPVNTLHSEIVYLKSEKYTQFLRLALTRELQWNCLSASQQIYFGYAKYLIQSYNVTRLFVCLFVFF